MMKIKIKMEMKMKMKLKMRMKMKMKMRTIMISRKLGILRTIMKEFAIKNCPLG